MKELIKNKDVGPYTMNKESFCGKCANKGYIEKPTKEDEKKFDEEYDRLDAMGCFNAHECYEKAIDGCRCQCFYCPDCEEGLKYSSTYPVYGGI